MGISNVKTSRDLSSAINYFGFSKAHNGHDERYISSRFVNCTEQGCIQQTKAVREYFGKDKNVEGLTFVFSFAEEEIGLFERDKQEKFMDSLRDVMHERFGNRQIGLFAQIDGTGQKFHVHAFVNSPDLETGKLIDGRLKLHENAREMLSEAMNRANIEDLNKNVPTKQANKTDIAIIKAKEKNPDAYIWKEDLQNRIKSVLNDISVTTPKKYMEALRDQGVEIKVRKSRKTKTGMACSYSFIDNDGKKRVARATKLGTDFQLESVNEFMRQHELMQREIEERKKQEGIERKQAGAPKPDDLAGLSSIRIDDLGLSVPSLTRRPQKRSDDVKPQTEGVRPAVLKRGVRHDEIRQIVSEPSKIDSKPLVQKIDKSVQGNSQKPSEKLSEPLSAVSENKTVNNITENVKANRSENMASEPSSENLLLNYIKNYKFVMYNSNGSQLKSLGDVPRTFEEHSNIRANRVLSDAELLHYAKTVKFTIAVCDEITKQYSARFSKVMTLSERFVNLYSKNVTNDLNQKADLAMNDVPTKSTDNDYGLSL